MWQTHRIACITYHKYPKDDWPAAEFAEIETTLPGGERVKLKLAERGTWIGDRKNGLRPPDLRDFDVGPSWAFRAHRRSSRRVADWCRDRGTRPR